MSSKDILIAVDDDRFRLCGAPAEDAARKVSVVIEIATPTGPRTKTMDWLVDSVITALYLIERTQWSGARAKFVRNALGLSMHELAYTLGEPDQTSVVARERGDIGFTVEQTRKLKAFVVSVLPLDSRDRIRTMATRATHGDGERLFFWI